MLYILPLPELPAGKYQHAHSHIEYKQNLLLRVLNLPQYLGRLKFMDRLSKRTEQMEETFIEVLKDFDIPDGRRNVKPENLRWIRRNVAIRNGDNPMLKWVMATIDCLLNE